MIDPYEEAMKFDSLCRALAMSEQCENWTVEQIEEEVHRIMDKEDGSPEIT